MRPLRARFAPLSAELHRDLEARFHRDLPTESVRRVLLDDAPAAAAAFVEEDGEPGVALLFDVPVEPTAAEDAWALVLGEVLADHGRAIAWIPHHDASWGASLFEALEVLLPWSQELPRSGFVRVIVTRRRFELAFEGRAAS